MKNIAQHAASLSVTAWVGSLWAIGYLAVPVLFYAQPDKHLAGMLAGQMFEKAGWLGLACGLYLLAFYVAGSKKAAFGLTSFRIAAVMLLIGLIMQLGIQPVMNGLKAQALPLDVMHSEFAAQFRMLHGISSIAYLMQSLLGVFLVTGDQKK